MPSPTPSLMLPHTLVLKGAGLSPQKELKKHHFKLCPLAAEGLQSHISSELTKPLLKAQLNSCISVDLS